MRAGAVVQSYYSAICISRDRWGDFRVSLTGEDHMAIGNLYCAASSSICAESADLQLEKYCVAVSR